MDTNKFVVANTTGNTTIAGTLSVGEAVTLSDALSVSERQLLAALQA